MAIAKAYHRPKGLSPMSLDALCTAFQFAIGNLIETGLYPQDKIQKMFLDATPRKLVNLGGPRRRRMTAALTALRDAELPEGFIQDLFESCYKAEAEWIEENGRDA